MDYVMRYHSPAEEWVEGLPLGNGRIGCMIWGATGDECFSLNADTLFRHNIHKRIQSALLMPDLRRLIQEGRGFDADKLFMDSVADLPENCNPYQPFFDLCCSSGINHAERYTRTLDLSDAVVSVSYEANDNRVCWEVFTSAADQLLVLLRTSDKPLTQYLRLTREEDSDCQYKVQWNGATGTFEACFVEGIHFAAAMAVETDGEIESFGEQLCVKNAVRLEIRVALATEYETPSCLEACSNTIDHSAASTYNVLLQNHIAEYQSLYNAMELSFGENDDRDVEELYASAMTDTPSPRLNALMFSYARYLIISSSRSNCLPLNLQGIWCHSIKPMWDCGYTTDMNVQMAYWMAEPANLSSCHSALFNWLDSQIPAMEQLCEDIFGVKDSAYIPQYTDAFLTPTCWKEYSAFQVLWSGAAPWLARHYYEHWRYTCDDTFGRERAFPMMKRCMNFYLQMLARDETGHYRLIPSTNPENFIAGNHPVGQLVDTATMDIAIVHDLARSLLEMNDKLGLNDPLAEQWHEMDERMADYPVDSTGTLLEWLDTRLPGDPGHRHLSHLYGVFPAHLAEFYAEKRDAVQKAIQRRVENGFDSSASWSFAWYACLFARLNDGEQSIAYIDHLVHGGLLSNLLTVHNDWRDSSYSHLVDGKIFQIDALLGSSAAICEMLVHSDNGTLYLLPALPKRWQTKGHVRGLAAPDNILIDMDWENGELTRVQLRTDSDRSLAVVYPNGTHHKLNSNISY